MTKYVGYLVFLAGLAVGVAWYVMRPSVPRPVTTPPPISLAPDATWLADLYSQNPRDTERGTAKVTELGVKALPMIQSTLQDPAAERDHRRAALRACAILGVAADPAIANVAAALPEADLTAEAAIALSFMGPKALPPLAAAVKSNDSVMRREALRSIGKLRFRAPLASSDVLPLLLDGMIDADGGVRIVAATYLGIVHENPEAAVPLLTQGLDDPDPDVRRASATALGSFGTAAAAALPGLRKAAADHDQDLAREAGRAVVAVSGGGK